MIQTQDRLDAYNDFVQKMTKVLDQRHKERTEALVRGELDNAKRLYQRLRKAVGLHARKETQAEADAELPRPLSWLIRELKRRLADLFDELSAGHLTPTEWRNQVKKALAEHHLAAIMAGLGTEVIPAKAWGGLVDNINFQVEFLNNFKIEIQDDAEFKPGWEVRARSYAESIKIPYWTGRTKVLPLPAMPGEGTQCLCITTPESRVYTKRGWVPIADVAIGDYVMTHLGRWRMVTATPRNKPTNTHRQAWIRGASGEMIGCTSDHKFLTDLGWKSANSIYNYSLNVYTIPYETQIMQSMRGGFEQPEYDGAMPSVSAELPELRRAEGLPRGGVSVVRDEQEGDGAVADGAREAIEGYSRRWPNPAHALRGLVGEQQLASAAGRTPLHLVLQNRCAPSDDLSLSMGVDQGAWANPGWLGSASQEQRPNGRPSGEPGTHDAGQPQFSPSGRRSAAGDGGGQRAQILHRGRVADLPEVPEAFSPARLRGEILLTGLLSGDSTLYDLTVDEDHSFIVEGLIAHNSGCNCQWDVKPIPGKENSYTAKWVLEPGSDHCQTCLVRSEQWNPLTVIDGVLQ